MHPSKSHPYPSASPSMAGPHHSAGSLLTMTPSQHAVGSHYAQAYAQYYHGVHPIPGTPAQHYHLPGLPDGGLPNATSVSLTLRKGLGPPPSGSVRCKKNGCTFYGSANAVEIHMMDRHLIYPPDWHTRKRKPEWDADPSLKGKRVPILGTTLSLDTPETIDHWVAERKKMFPTAQHVEEKQRKLEEARKRGQLGLEHRRKRPRPERGNNNGWEDRGAGMRGKRGRGKGRDFVPHKRGEKRPEVDQERIQKGELMSPQAISGSVPHFAPEESLGKHSGQISGSESDSGPEVLSSKHTTQTLPEQQGILGGLATSSNSTPSHATRFRQPPHQPRKPMHNPFSLRPSLLRNLLLPEIRITVSNLSQAIRFLVDNDFLVNVELKPGQAHEQRRIEVVSQGSSRTNGDTPMQLHETPGPPDAGASLRSRILED